MKKTINLCISGICNLDCTYCDLNFDSELMSYTRFHSIIRQHGKDAYYILTGGEPTLHPQFWRFVRFLEVHDYEGQVITNGAIRPMDLKEIERLKVNVSLSSLDVNRMNAKDRLTWKLLPKLHNKDVVLSPMFNNNAEETSQLLEFAKWNGWGVTLNINIQSREASEHYHVMETINIDELFKFAKLYQLHFQDHWFVTPDILWRFLWYLKKGQYWKCDPELKNEYEWFYHPSGKLTHCCLREDVYNCGGCLDVCGMQSLE